MSMSAEKEREAVGRLWPVCMCFAELPQMEDGPKELMLRRDQN